VVFTAEGRTAVKRAWQDDPAVLLEFLAPPALPAAPEPAETAADMDLDALLSIRAQAGPDAS
jgi:hypothetical protein